MPQLAILRLLALLLPIYLAGCGRTGDWNRQAAARHLDRRAQRWLGWQPAARAQGTVCISCHTAMPYLLVRDTLTPAASHGEPAPEQELLASVLARAQRADQIPPYYPDQAAGSRGTEAVLNALILADRDARIGGGQLSAPTQAALARMWSLQRTTGPHAGSWAWIQFRDEPWEAPDSVYYGATLAALTVCRAGSAYRRRAEIQPGLARLHDYLVGQSARQAPLRRIELLWAAGGVPGLLAPARRDAIVAEIWARQGADGGWNLASLMPQIRRRDGTAEPGASDGYATGIATLALQVAGVSPRDPRLHRGLTWLIEHQSRWNGGWSAASLNHRYGIVRGGNQRHFMDDAATAFAVMTLEQSSRANASTSPE